MNIETCFALLISFIILLYVAFYFKNTKVKTIVILGIIIITFLFVYRLANFNIPYIDGQIQTNIPNSSPTPKKPIKPEINISKPNVYGDTKKELDSDIESYTGINKK